MRSRETIDLDSTQSADLSQAKAGRTSRCDGGHLSSVQAGNCCRGEPGNLRVQCGDLKGRQGIDLSGCETAHLRLGQHAHAGGSEPADLGGIQCAYAGWGNRPQLRAVQTLESICGQDCNFGIQGRNLRWVQGIDLSRSQGTQGIGG